MAPVLRLGLCAVGLLLGAAPQVAIAATLTVRVAGVKEPRGKLYIAVCDEAHFTKTCALSAVVAASDGVGAAFPDIAPGRYAVKVFWDIDGDGKADTNRLGLPTEPYAFSGVRTLIPNFAKAAFEVRGEPLTVTVRLAP